MKSQRKLLFFLPLFSLSLLSCSIWDDTKDFKYIEADTTLKKMDPSVFSYDLPYSSEGRRTPFMPAIGEQKALVMPIEFPDFPFNDNITDYLDEVFNSEAPSYFESLKTFYQKSSFGKLNITAEVLPIYRISENSYEAMNKVATYQHRSTDFMREAYNYYLEQNLFEPQDYDLNGDGYIDAVYLIYSSPNYLNGRDYYLNNGLREDRLTEFWAYTYWDYTRTPNKENPYPSSYTWLSVDFFSLSGDKVIDSRTLIHETSHLTGIKDYYNTDENNPNYKNLDYKYYSPVGGLDMMDLNLGDHNMFTKYMLGWASPYVVTSDLDFPITIELEDSNHGSFLIIPTSNDFNGNPFSEYLLLEFYVPEGLNKLDSTYRYRGNYPLLYSSSGLKIYHVDARLKNRHRSGASYVDGDIVPSITKEDIVNSTSDNFYTYAFSNTPSESKEEGKFLIHLLESNGVNTFQNKDYNKYHEKFFANNGSLFNPDSKHGYFDAAKFKGFFKEKDENGFIFNDGNFFPYRIKINGAEKKGASSFCSLTIEQVSYE